MQVARETNGRTSGVADALLNSAGDAIGDIRTKLIDEGWFGRSTASPETTGANSLGWDVEPSKPRTSGEMQARLSFEEAWATRDRPIDKLDPDYDLDIDR